MYLIVHDVYDICSQLITHVEYVLFRSILPCSLALHGHVVAHLAAALLQGVPQAIHIELHIDLVLGCAN